MRRFFFVFVLVLKNPKTNLHHHEFSSLGQACISGKIYARAWKDQYHHLSILLLHQNLSCLTHHSITCSMLWCNFFERLQQHGEHSQQVYELQAYVLSLAMANGLLTFVFFCLTYFLELLFTCFLSSTHWLIFLVSLIHSNDESP